ncbi:Thiamine-monophosphate kinase [uncultured Candidatus Thioglobus sp.]|nr:Thiamine-monophosphate kinase [uncultured Candidatus Thioglobus sp.]
MNEFDLIEKYFNWYPNSGVFGVGDDCALVTIGAKQHIATTVDTLIEGVHFPKNTTAADIAYKVLAVNLSDLAAMGATPLYFTLALTLPNIDEQWLEEFSSELKSLAEKYNIRLVGGDTTKGTLSITINVTGTVAKSKALLRSGAKLGDEIFVSNTLGDAALAWQQIQGGKTPSEALLAQFNRPEPKIELGQALAGVANSCIDISDGLEQDLSHILSCSNVGAKIALDALPLSADVAKYISKTQDWCVALAGGDDYELCFTVPKSHLDALEAIQDELGINLSKIGVITKSGLDIEELDESCQSYRHF